MHLILRAESWTEAVHWVQVGGDRGMALCGVERPFWPPHPEAWVQPPPSVPLANICTGCAQEIVRRVETMVEAALQDYV